MFCIVYLLNAMYVCINKMMNAMMNANLVKNDKQPIILTQLKSTERTLLSKRIIRRGQLKHAVQSIGRDQNTIKRAIAGFKITQDTADKIRTFLNSL